MVSALTPELRCLVNRSSQPHFDMDFVYPIFASVIAICGFPFAAHTLWQKSDRIDRHIGNLAYPLYLIHVVPIILMNQHVAHLSQFQRLPHTLLATCISLIVAILIYFLVDVPLDRLRANFIKERMK